MEKVKDMAAPWAMEHNGAVDWTQRHTQGPWHVAHCTNVTGWCVRAADDTLLAIVANSTVETKTESWYNAQAMAAAAEMLEALENLVDACKDIEVNTPAILKMGQRALEAQRTIDKARGRLE